MSAQSLNARCEVLRVALLESRIESLLADYWGRRLAHVLLDSDPGSSFHLEPRCARGDDEEEDDAEVDDDEEFEEEDDDVEEDLDEELEEYDDDSELEVDDDDDDF
ncbi:MAG: hypothetical protein CHACPFDD_03790 [Phycisphaerae bacterium]|nr:hypothetical protein [Phycisphaerae bacterium]